MSDIILTMRQVAEHLRIKAKTACQPAAGGKLLGFKVEGAWLFEQLEVANWIMRKIDQQQQGAECGH